MTEEAIDQRMDAYVNAMLDSRGLFYASSSVGQDEWRDYVASSNLTFRYPGIQALGYIERVRPEQRDDHFEHVREEGQASYELWPLANATSPSTLRTSNLRALPIAGCWATTRTTTG